LGGLRLWLQHLSASNHTQKRVARTNAFDVYRTI
jgi:hypothetical protein